MDDGRFKHFRIGLPYGMAYPDGIGELLRAAEQLPEGGSCPVWGVLADAAMWSIEVIAQATRTPEGITLEGLEPWED